MRLFGELKQTASGICARLVENGELISFSFRDISIALVTDCASFVNYSRDYFRSYFRGSTSPVADMSIFASASKSTFDAVCELAPVPKDKLDANGYFVFPARELTSVVYQRAIEVEGECEAYYIIDRANRQLTIVTPSSGFPGQLLVMRALRTAMKVCLMESGCVPLHCACVVRTGRAIGIIGEKYAGKTTTMLNALLGSEFDYLSNDKVFLDDTGEEQLICGLPTSAGIRDDILAHLSGMDRLLKTGRRTTYFQEAQGKVYLRPEQIASHCSCEVVPYAPIGCFVLPKYDPDPGRTHSELLKVDNERAEQTLADQILVDVFPDLAHWSSLIEIASQRFSDRRDRIIARIAEKYPMYLLIQNERTNQESRRLLRRLSDGFCRNGS